MRQKRAGYGSAIGLSPIVLGGDFGQRTDGDSFALLDAYVASGGACIETGHAYAGGNAERQIGRWLESRGCRDDVVLIDKCCHPGVNGEPRVDPAAIRSDLARSLDRLGVDDLDLLILHRDQPETQIDDIVAALDACVAAGRIRAYGLANWTRARLIAAVRCAQANGWEPPRVASLHYSLASQTRPMWPGSRAADPDDRRLLRALDIPLLAWSALARGWLADPARRSDANRDEVYDCALNRERRARASELAARKGATLPQICLAFVLAEPGAAASVGPQTVGELHDCLGALRIGLDESERSWLMTGNERA